MRQKPRACLAGGILLGSRHGGDRHGGGVPNRLWSLGVLGLAGNKKRARQWYQRASELGNAEAKARITALGF